MGKSFVIKPCDLCDSGGVYLIKNRKNIKTNEAIEPRRIIQELYSLRSQIQDEYYMHEKMYGGLIPWSGYIVEELLLNAEGEIPQDYKCYVFGGKLYFTAMTYSREANLGGEQTFKSIWLDRNGIPLKYPMIKKGYEYKKIKLPANYPKMVRMVEAMGEKLKRHCRIDVYIIGDKVYLGEFTFFCGARLHTQLCNLKLGVKWLQYPDDYSFEDPKLKLLVPKFYNLPSS